ncbi:MAG TPA: adenosylcobalamin-dependent ribonucleoside-diphosphate reductase [Planctomycetota bacterium]|nr:adenosylcobalamin-dependent ribonucleoside-diphosphate reductase [Planctomycetota bacterium]
MAEELHLTRNARIVLEKRYLRKDESGRVIETPEEMVRRVARVVAAPEAARGGPGAAEAWAARFERAVRDLDFLPNSPTLMNAGTDLGNLAACFVVPVPDTMDGIFEALKRMAVIHKSGGGTGFSFSRLRPKNDVVASTGGIASGPVSFMDVFDAATDVVKQGGRRRGANMAILRVDHPDILEFVEAKRDERRLRNFNISVGVTDAFMRAVAADASYALVNPRTGRPAGEARAREVFDRIVATAWRTGDPGLVFLDEVNRANPTPEIGALEATNPCGEQPLLPYEACNLGSVNLARFVRDGDVDWTRLGEMVELGVRFLDDTIDAARYPFPEIDAMVRANRKIGLGVMGFAEMLIRLGVPYTSPEALALGERIATFVEERAHAASRALAAERGPFPNFAMSIWAARGAPVRNATVTTVAPTGTISIIAGTTSGIEPLYAVVYVRNVLGGEQLLEVNPLFEDAARRAGCLSNALLRRILREGSVARVPEVPEELRRLFVTAGDVPPGWHVRVQAAFQRHCDNGVSKTVNLPFEATEADVRRVYELAWELRCKGITVFRSGCKGEQVLAQGTAEEAGLLFPEGEGTEGGDVCHTCVS